MRVKATVRVRTKATVRGAGDGEGEGEGEHVARRVLAPLADRVRVSAAGVRA